MGRKQLIMNQKKDPDLIPLISSALPPEEAAKVGECLYLKDDVLMRKWRPPDAPLDQEWQVVHQIVVPKIYRRDIISLAHDTYSWSFRHQYILPKNFETFLLAKNEKRHMSVL